MVEKAALKNNDNNMSISRLFLIMALCMVAANGSAQCCRHDSAQRPCHKADSMQAVSPSSLIIWYDASSRSNKKRLMKAVRKYHATVLYDYRTFSGIAIRIPDGTDIHKAIDYFKNVKGVLSVNRDRIMHLD